MQKIELTNILKAMSTLSMSKEVRTVACAIQTGNMPRLILMKLVFISSKQNQSQYTTKVQLNKEQKSLLVKASVRKMIHAQGFQLISPEQESLRLARSGILNKLLAKAFKRDSAT